MTVTPPDGRRAVFVGDYGDRGPDTPARAASWSWRWPTPATAICLPGNHDVKLVRKLKGRDVQITHGLAETLEQLDAESDEFRDAGPRLPRRAGQPRRARRRQAGRRARRDEAGLSGPLLGAGPRLRAVRRDDRGDRRVRPAGPPASGRRDYRGEAAVVYGHTPVAEPEWVNNTINIDTGCVFGGRLTALRWPERELVSVAARARPTTSRSEPLPAARAAAIAEDRPAFLLDVDDVAGKRIVETALARTVTIREENAAAALEVMSRFAIDPRWLVYLPPTMAPTATSQRPDLLEHPEEAFAEYRREGVAAGDLRGEAHGLARDRRRLPRRARSPARRFGVDTGETGAIYTRTGRPFFDSGSRRARRRSRRVRAAVDTAGLWEELGTDWLVLDCELLPWSAKAMELDPPPVRRRSAPPRRPASPATIATLEQAAARGLDVAELIDDRALAGSSMSTATSTPTAATSGRSTASTTFASRRFTCSPPRAACSPTAITPGTSTACDRLVAADPDWFTPDRPARRSTSPTTTAARPPAIAWWEELTAGGRRGDGRQADQLHRPRAARAWSSPASNAAAASTCASSTAPSTPTPARSTACATAASAASARLAVREFGLGVEALERFVRRRAALPRPRMRLRRPRAGERAGRPAALTVPGLWIPGVLVLNEDLDPARFDRDREVVVAVEAGQGAFLPKLVDAFVSICRRGDRSERVSRVACLRGVGRARCARAGDRSARRHGSCASGGRGGGR